MRSIGGLLVTALAIAADNPPPSAPNAWTLKYSDPSREGRFLDIPLHYGDWVPIDHAKALVEKVANRFTQEGVGTPAVVHQRQEQAHARQDQPHKATSHQRQDLADDRVDTGEPVFVNTYPRHRGQKRRPPPPQQHRRQDVRFPGQQKPSHYGYQGHQDHSNNRRNRKLPPPKPHQNNLFRGKPQKVAANPQNPSLGFGFVPSLKPLQSFNPFKFFESAKPERPTTFTTGRPQQQQQEQSYLESLNAIQTIPAPDLSKFGPPVIELDSGADGQIILGKNYQFAGEDRDHLAGFVSLDFDGFTPGDREAKKPKKQQEKEKLSILVGTDSNLGSADQSDLVNFLNNNKDNAEAFVINSNNDAPEGFSKIDLPFMDPTKHKGFLPKAFIAPKGIPIPKGYKGKPLPQRQSEEISSPAPGSWLEITTRRPVVLVTAAPEEVLKLQEADDNVKPISLFDRRPSAFRRPKPTPEQVVTEAREVPTTTETAKASTHSFTFKLQKARPSFQEYLRNKKKAEYVEEEFQRPEKKDIYRKTERLDRGYGNSKIKGARKEFKDARSSTERTTTTFHLPADHLATNVFRLVTESTIKPTDESQVTVDETDQLVDSFFAAGSNNAFLGPDVDDDTISIVYQPADDVAKPETTTVFSPTVLPTLVETTTTILEPTYSSPVETTTVPEVEVITTTEDELSTASSTTTTSTTTTTIASTTSSTADSLQESTKGGQTTQDPLDKLEALRKKKQGIVNPKPSVYQGDLLSGDEIDDSATVVTSGPIFNLARRFRNRSKFKKFKTLPGLKAQLEASRANGDSPLPGFGRRIRKKRPYWAGQGRFKQGFGLGQSGSVEPTVRPGQFKLRSRLNTTPTQAAAGDDTEVIVKTEEAKRNLRPFFDQLYREVAEEGGKDSRRFGLPRRRSTTAAPPVTVDAPALEIYEVDPQTRLRITTRRPLTTERRLLPEEPTTASVGQESSKSIEGTDDQADFVYERTTEDGRITTEQSEDITTRVYEPTAHSTTISADLEPTTTETEEVQETTSAHTTIASETTTGTTQTDAEVHETADKHSTTTQLPEEATTESLQNNEIDDGSVVKPVLEEELELLTLDIANEIVDQVYEESQVVETTFKGKTDDEEPTVPSGRLTSYEKNIDTSQFGEDKEYKEEDLKNQVVNEHGQQKASSVEEKYAGWKASAEPLKPYFEINRKDGEKPIVSIEEVKITESKDYSEPDIIYDDTRESFDDDSRSDSFSVPVSVAFNVPETTTLTTFETSTSTATEEPTTVAATTEGYFKRYNPTTYSRIYSLINRNKRPFTTTTTEGNVREVFLGTTRRSSLDISGAQTAAPTTEAVFDVTEKTYETAHKVPGKLWSAYEISREATTEEIEIEPVPEVTPLKELDEETSVNTERDEINTEGLNLASIMSYSMPDENSNATALPGIVEIEELPKPNDHESEVLVVEQVPESATNDPRFHKLPKAIDLHHPEEKSQAESHTFGAEHLVPLRQKDGKYSKKSETKTKKREEWIKNWVGRKYNKFQRTPLLPLASVHSQQESNVQTTTENAQEDPSVLTDSAQNQPQHSLLVPTIPPKNPSDTSNLPKGASIESSAQSKQQPNSRFNVNLDVTVRDGTELSDLKSTLLEKYSSSRYKKKNKNKNSLFHREEVKSSPVFGSGVVRGADTDLFRSYGGKSLSQSDFERQILGVSTATEISVKSMICVKGQCFNADDMGKLLSK